MAESTTRIYEQIETTAGLNSPSIYDLLLTYQNVALRTTDDSLASQFIPLTAVPTRSRRDVKLFVIGLIPPSANVTGRLLDRSATIAHEQGFADPSNTEPEAQAPLERPLPDTGGSGPDPVYTLPGYQIPVVDGNWSPGVEYGTKGTASPDPVITQLSPTQLYQAIYDAYSKKFGHPPTPTECLIYTTQSMRETGGAWPNNNPGYIGNFKDERPNTFNASSQTGGKDTGWYVTYPDVADGATAFINAATRNANARTAAQRGDVLGYATAQAQNGYYGDSIKNYYDKGRYFMARTAAALQKAGGPDFGLSGKDGGLPPAPDTCAFKEDIWGFYERTGYTRGGKNTNRKGLPSARLKAGANYDGCTIFPDPAAEPSTPATGTEWQQSGEANAGSAQKDTGIKAGTDLNQSALGQALQAQQKATIKALQSALDNMARTPPLKLLVNPSSFKVTEAQIITDGDWTRNGPIVEHWGPDQTKISASGRLAGFYALSTQSADGVPGLNRTARHFSTSYQNFLSLYLIYRNNGGVWIEDLTDQTSSKPNNLSLVGSVYIYYDNTLYIGSFSSLNVSESADKPFSLEYDFEFVVRASFLLDFANDPTLTYGAPELFASNTEAPLATTPTPLTPEDPLASLPVMSQEEIDAFFEAKIQEQEDADARKARTAELRAQDPTTKEPWVDPPPNTLDTAKGLFAGIGRNKKPPAEPSSGTKTLTTPTTVKKGTK